ncbi:MAG: phosphoribosylformylglycinamidine synthase, partial [Patescibacteria group bacterium]
MAHRIEVFTKVNDTKSILMQQKLSALGFNVSAAKVVEVYTINKNFTKHQLQQIAEILSNPVSQTSLIDKTQNETDFDFALEIGFLPGVTDNVATTAKETIEEFSRNKFNENESIHSSTLIFLKGKLDQSSVKKIGDELANNLIQRIHIKSHEKFEADNGMDTVVPKVSLTEHPQVDDINLNLPEEELIKLGKEGIKNKDGTRRGPLALEKSYLKTIKNYFKKENRDPTDIELESIAQTWSEHCKHTIFAAKIDDNENGLYKGYIKRATNEIRKQKGSQDFCVSVFSDNAGGIIFDKNWIVTDKAETHNSPSALDPFGGAITGIVGV